MAQSGRWFGRRACPLLGDAASKSRAHFEFIHPESVKGEDIRNVLVKYKAADELFPHKPTRVCELVKKRSGKPFSIHNHTQAWQLYKVRPQANAKQPQNTNKDYCIYHAAHGDYTYSDKWVDRLVEEIADNQRYDAIKAVKVG